GLAARVNAWRDQNNVIPDAAGGRYLVIGDGIPVLGGDEPAKKLVEIVKGMAKEEGHAPQLLVIDTLRQALDDDENDAKVVAPVLRALSNMRKKFGCSVLIVHHLVKLNAKGERAGKPVTPTRDSIRGSGALTRNVETVLGLMSDEKTGRREL